MKRYFASAVALIAAVVVLVVFPFGAGAISNSRFVLGIQGSFDTGGGTFHVAGAVSDSGTFDSTFVAVQKHNGCFDNPSLDWTFTGGGGTITMHGTGTACIDNNGRGIFDATFKITGGSGTYANLSGNGSATGELDNNDGTFTTVFDGTAHFAR